MDEEYGRLLAENARYAATFNRSALTAAPLRALAILTCMDARIDVEDALGLRVGDAHIVRNAGGLASADAIRSIVVSQQLLGTREIVVIGHTRCGLEGVKSVCLALQQSERYGTPLGQSLRVMAQENRDMRMNEAEKKAAALPPKLTVPMILFFLPCLFIVILGPTYIKLQVTPIL